MPTLHVASPLRGPAAFPELEKQDNRERACDESKHWNQPFGHVNPPRWMITARLSARAGTWSSPRSRDQSARERVAGIRGHIGGARPGAASNPRRRKSSGSSPTVRRSCGRIVSGARPSDWGDGVSVNRRRTEAAGSPFDALRATSSPVERSSARSVVTANPGHALVCRVPRGIGAPRDAHGGRDFERHRGGDRMPACPPVRESSRVSVPAERPSRPLVRHAAHARLSDVTERRTAGIGHRQGLSSNPPCSSTPSMPFM